MISTYLKALYKTEDTPVRLYNDLYGFDVKSIKPAGKDYQLLYTDGLADYTQPVPENLAELQHIELYFLLPEYWNFDERYWPIEWIERIAQVPKKNATWFGYGDTLPAGNPPAFVDVKLEACYFILSQPMMLAEELSDLDKQPFRMLAIIPIFEKEFEFKVQNSATAFFQQLARKNGSELVDIFREPVARKKFMGLF